MTATINTVPTATFESLNATHLLILCPRGFANERKVVTIPGNCMADAQEVEQSANPRGYVDKTRLVAIADASELDREEAGLLLKQFATKDEYWHYLYSPEGALFSTLDF